MNMRRSWVSLLLLFLAPPETLPARVPDAGTPLVKTAGDLRIPPHEPDSSIIREQAIEVDLRLARDPQTTRLRLPLFGGPAALELVRTSREVTRKGSVIWWGRVDGQPASTVTFSASKEVLIANIATQPTKEKSADYYEIRYLGGNRHVLRKIDPSKLPPESDPTLPEPEGARSEGPPPFTDAGIVAAARRNLSKAALRRSPAADDPIPTCRSDPKSTIDALVVYTTKAKDKAEGQDAMEQAINLAIAETNDSYERSGVQQRLRLVHMQEVTDSESGSPDRDLRALKRRGGKFGDVLDVRDDVGADIVGLIVEYTEAETDSCGMAYVMEEESNAFERSAFAAVTSRCAAAPGKWSLTHEFGHVMGAHHDWADDQGDKPFLFSHGFVHTGAPAPAFRTLMSKCVRCSRVPYWSNPDVSYPPSGVAMGSPDSAKPTNNSMTLNETADTVANFRCRQN